MEERIKEILEKAGVKKIVNTLTIITLSLIKSKSISIRQLADFIPSNTQKQSKVNRIWRFINKSKLFKPLHIYKAMINILFSLFKIDQIIIDFTSLRGC